MLRSVSNSLRSSSSRLFGLRMASYKADEKHFGQFYTVNPIRIEGDVKGEILDHTIDLSKCRPGEEITVPYEITINHSFRDMWHSAFYCHDRIQTSTPFARHLGLQDQVIPFSQMLFLAGSMSHADHAKIQLGFGVGVYHWPAFSGDTFRKKFTIRRLRTTSDGNNSIATIACEIRNQRDVNLFTCEKHMMFPFHVPASEVVVPVTEEAKSEPFLNYLVSNSDKLKDMGSHTLSHLRPGQLIFHTLVRPLSPTVVMQLATLARLTHERHFNSRKYGQNELLVPGGLVFALTSSLASRDLHEVIFEELVNCAFPNNLCPGETVSAMTFIRHLSEHVSGDLEEIDIRTIAVKNTEVHSALEGVTLPAELFANADIHLPAKLEEMLKRDCPALSKKIVCIADRKIYRQAPKQTPFLL